MKSYVRDSISTKESRERLKKDQRIKAIFLLAALLSSSVIAIITTFISVKGISPFLSGYSYGRQDIVSFLTGVIWRRDQGIYGVGFIIINTLVSVSGTLVISSPLSVLTALFIAKIASKRVAGVMTTVMGLLASISSVVYGVFASDAITVSVSSLASSLDFVTAGGSSLLTVVLLLAIMIFPTVTSLLIAAIRSVDREVELDSPALGAARAQTNFKVVLTSAKSGIFAEVILGIDRAFGEAATIAMIAGNRMFGPTVNVLDTTGTLITTILAGLKKTTGLDYDMRFSADLVLTAVTLLSSLLLNLTKRKVGNMK